MSVLDGRRLRFRPAPGLGVYEVDAHPVSRLVGGAVHLGTVQRQMRSTDSTVGGRGSRIRRPGKGAPCWRAEVPREYWEEPKDRSGEPIPGRPRTAGQLQSVYGGGFRLEEFGEAWDRREDAGAALAAWYDSRERR